MLYLHIYIYCKETVRQKKSYAIVIRRQRISTDEITHNTQQLAGILSNLRS